MKSRAKIWVNQEEYRALLSVRALGLSASRSPDGSPEAKEMARVHKVLDRLGRKMAFAMREEES